MARIRVLQAVGGLDFSWAPGDVVEVDEAAAAVWADGVRADLVDGPQVAEAAENTASRSRRGGRAPKAETR